MFGVGQSLAPHPEFVVESVLHLIDPLIGGMGSYETVRHGRAQGIDPGWDRATWVSRLLARCCRPDGLGECSSLGDGWQVYSVVGEDAFEGVAGLVEVMGLGDHEHEVLGASAGGTDVEAATGGVVRDEFDRRGRRVALVAVFRGG